MKPPVRPRGAASLPREVRLIGGQWKRRKLPIADRPGLRPTPDRVRETLFNWLGQDLSGWTCLDAFAGSGALGFEAASRGAAAVVLLERDPVLARNLEAQRERLGATMVRIERADALSWMQRQPSAGFDLVFIDPPFDADLFEVALGHARALVRPAGFLYLEADRAFEPAALAAGGWTLHRHLRAGRGACPSAGAGLRHPHRGRR